MAAGDVRVTLPATGGVCRVEIPTEAGGPETFLCSYATIGRLLIQAAPEAPTPVSTDWVDLLAASTPGVAVQSLAKPRRIVLAFPARQRVMTFPPPGDDDDEIDDDEIRDAEYTMWLPPMVWVLNYQLPRDVLTSAAVFCTPVRVASVRDQTLVSPFPFGNVYAEHGRVCWGAVTISTLSSRDPVAVDNLFFGSRFNGDLTNWHRSGGNSQEPFGSRRAWTNWQAAHPTQVAWVEPGRLSLVALLNGAEEAA